MSEHCNEPGCTIPGKHYHRDTPDGPETVVEMVPFNLPEHRIKAADSPRWCEHCQSWGDHHTDRCWRQIPLAKDRPELVPVAEWTDPGKSEPGAGWPEVLLCAVVAVAAIALCVWLLSRELDPCPGGWQERTSPNAIQCFSPKYDRPPRPSVQSSEQPHK